VTPDPAFWAVVAVALVLLAVTCTGLGWVDRALKRRRPSRLERLLADFDRDVAEGRARRAEQGHEDGSEDGEGRE